MEWRFWLAYGTAVVAFLVLARDMSVLAELLERLIRRMPPRE